MTLYVNGGYSEARKQMLINFIYANDVEIAMLQEVTKPDFVDIPTNNASINIGAEKRGTATLAKEGLSISDERRLPSGRGLAVKIKEVWYVDIYAPSGAEKRTSMSTSLMQTSPRFSL
jgi:exonuclease III